MVDGAIGELPDVGPEELLPQVDVGPPRGEAADERAVAAVEGAVGALGEERLGRDAVGPVDSRVCGPAGRGGAWGDARAVRAPRRAEALPPQPAAPLSPQTRGGAVDRQMKTKTSNETKTQAEES